MRNILFLFLFALVFSTPFGCGEATAKNGVESKNTTPSAPKTETKSAPATKQTPSAPKTETKSAPATKQSASAPKTETKSAPAPKQSASIESKKTVGMVHVKNQEFKQLVDAKAGVLIDVRTPREHASGAIPGTDMNINVSSPSFKKELAKLDKGGTYLLYCRSGGRSGRAMRIMDSMGFKNVYNLRSGLLGWQRVGLPVK